MSKKGLVTATATIINTLKIAKTATPVQLRVLTGMSNTKTHTALAWLERKGVIIKVRVADKNRPNIGSWTYTLKSP